MTVKERGSGQSLKAICRLLGYTRQAYHKRHRREEREAAKSELIVQEVIKIRSVQKRLGVRKLYHMLECFLGEHTIEMGRDRLYDLLRENSLLVRRRRPRKPRTTISGPWRRYPNLIRDYVPTSANQMWVSGHHVCESRRGLCIPEPYNGRIFEKDSRIQPVQGSEC